MVPPWTPSFTLPAAGLPRGLRSGEARLRPTAASAIHADFEGRDELVAQVDSATVVGYCGCASVNLQVDPDAPRAHGTPSPVPNQATVLDADGEPIGGIWVVLDGGYLSSLDIFDWLDPTGISPLPPLERLKFDQCAG